MRNNIIRGGLAAGILDALDAIIAFKITLGLDPLSIYQFVASGILGKAAFAGGAAVAGLGLAIHFGIAFTAAAVYNLAATRVASLRTHFVRSGLAFGVAVYGFMTYVVIPASAIGPSPWSLPLFVNGVVGHALLVGLPIAYFARRGSSRSDSDRVARRIVDIP
jgi:hypothetical protein